MSNDIQTSTALAFSIYSGKGVYALLLGSGVSRAAGIPTGYEVIVDLIRKIAKAEQKAITGEEIGWFTNTYGKRPTYSTLLEQLTPIGKNGQGDRRNLLKHYFEPIDEDASTQARVPTKAHKAIAELVKNGFIKVIVTTNFDRLMEKALEEQGVTPHIISGENDINGMIPLPHSDVTVVKLHGDYVKVDLRNTTDELSKYPPKLGKLLERILDEYGLVICGWSAEYDHALRGAIERCANRRYGLYWTSRENLSVDAKSLIDSKKASSITIKDADTFWVELKDKILALTKIDPPHPLTPKIAVTRLKKYLSEDRYRIDLRDLVSDETKFLHDEIWNTFPNSELLTPPQERTTIDDILSRAEKKSETLVRLIANGSYHGIEQYKSLWTDAITRVIERPVRENRHVQITNGCSLTLYPAALLFYAAGIAAFASGHYYAARDLLNRTVVEPLFSSYSEITEKLGLVVSPSRMISATLRGQLNSGNNTWSLEERMYGILKEQLTDIIFSDREFEDAFARFEVTYTLAMMPDQPPNEAMSLDSQLSPYGLPLGRLRQFKFDGASLKTIGAMLKELEEHKTNMPIFKYVFTDQSSGSLDLVMRKLRILKDTVKWS